MPSPNPDFVGCHFMLGGADLEMATIRELLNSHGKTCHDKHLSWSGAKASAYEEEIRKCIATPSNKAVLVELEDDLPADIEKSRLLFIDHHGARAGKHRPGSLRQVFDLLGLPEADWSRDFALVQANDIGHSYAMLALNPPATLPEMLAVRRRDRQAQGITPEEEEIGRAAAEKATLKLDGRLTIVELPHRKTATVADVLDANLGGPGFQTLLIRLPGETTVFGPGPVIDTLRRLFPGGWYGGNLPERGYWGYAGELAESVVATICNGEVP